MSETTESEEDQTELEDFWEVDGAAEIVGQADEFDEQGVWSPHVELDSEVDQTTSPLSKADSSGKVVLTYVYRMEMSERKKAQLRNYISEAQTLRRHGASVMRSFDPDSWGSTSPIYRVIKTTWSGERTTLLSGNVSENLNKVGEAFAAWEANGYRERGASPPQYGTKSYVALRGDSVKDIWRTDGGRYGVTVQLGKTRGESHDPGRAHTFDVILDYGSHQLKAIDAAYEGNVNTGSAEIHERDGEFFYHQTISYEQPVYDYKDINRWVGIDLGTVSLYSLAVIESAEDSPKNNGIDVLTTEHGPGGELMHERRQHKASLQHLQETRGYEVASEKLGKRLSRHCLHLEHRYANEIIKRAQEFEPCGIVFEDLIGIKGLGWSHLWSYFRFKQVIAYKAHRAGIPVITLTKDQTQGTSQKCSVCGHNPHDKDGDSIPEKADITGRISRGEYWCDECGYGPVDADTNAAINIGSKLLS